MIRAAYVCSSCGREEQKQEKWRLIFVSDFCFAVCPDCWKMATRAGQLISMRKMKRGCLKALTKN